MEAKLINGKETSLHIREKILEDVQRLTASGCKPGLAVVLVGDDPASVSYVTGKTKTALELGIQAFDYKLPEATTEEELLELIANLNKKPEVHGILVQLPLPRHINPDTIIASISISKDVDGLNPASLGNLFQGNDAFFPCTPHGVIKLLEEREIHTAGKHVVVVGRSNLVGKPMAALLLRKGPFADATVTVCHSKTPDIGAYVRLGDIVIAALGKPRFITADMVKPGAVVIDVGVTRIPDASKKSGFRLCGDVDFEPVSKIASYLTPVPGGVGPMTITMLMYNTVKAAALSSGQKPL